MIDHEKALAKLKQLPEPLQQEVADFIDFLLLKQNPERGQQSELLADSTSLAAAGMDNYLSNLEKYEEKLARGEIQRIT